ncbi:hypothetical protein [Poseidonocella sp. HB161398]|uniref:hypothetical protein n=1 Tax=Poseidonocella sp. HB161398 TaxID=2320855 RepID=UPI001107C26F|nr:hypothetical protein [Poseidonocella sp. HB161398]
MSWQDRHGLHIRTFAIGEGQILQRIRAVSGPWKDGAAIAAADPAFLGATAWTAPDGTTRLRLHPGDSAGAIAEYCSNDGSGQ